jgi:hypothetical protein
MLLIEPAALQFMEDAVVQAIRLLKFERIEPLGAWFSARLAEWSMLTLLCRRLTS